MTSSFLQLDGFGVWSPRTGLLAIPARQLSYLNCKCSKTPKIEFSLIKQHGEKRRHQVTFKKLMRHQGQQKLGRAIIRRLALL